MEDTGLIRKILFNILVIITILFIYYLFFPKKSYVDDKLKKLTSPNDTTILNKNMTNMEIASKKYFEENEETKVTLQELIEKNILVNDDSNPSCSKDESYAELKENKIYIYLKCNNQESTKEIALEKTPEEKPVENETKQICIYQYEKTKESEYTEWSEWSEWQKEEIKEDDLTKVETKVEEEVTGTTTEGDYEEVSIDAYSNTKKACPEGYSENGDNCIKKEKLNTIEASISYSCPQGYSRNGFDCYKDGKTTKATKEYYCPSNTTNVEFELSGSSCTAYNITKRGYLQNQTYYTCPDDYELRGNKCYTTEYYEEEVESTEEVTYYRYQKRSKINEKLELRWSHLDDEDLLNNGYVATIKIFCDL